MWKAVSQPTLIVGQQANTYRLISVNTQQYQHRVPTSVQRLKRTILSPTPRTRKALRRRLVLPTGDRLIRPRQIRTTTEYFSKVFRPGVG